MSSDIVCAVLVIFLAYSTYHHFPLIILLSLQHTPRVIGQIPDPNHATLDHERLSGRLCLTLLIVS